MILHRRPRTPRAPVWVRRPRTFSIGPLVVAAVALVVDLVTLPFHPHPVPAALAVVVSAVGVAVVRRWPPLATVLVAAAPVLAAVGDADPTTTWTVGVFVAFVLTTRGGSAPLTALVTGAANFAAVGLHTGSVSLDEPFASIAAFAAVAFAATGSAVRNQRAYWSELDHSTREAVAGRDAAVRQQIAEERLRIARDLHDTVGHQVAVVSMHLGAAEVQVPAESPARAHLVAARTGVRAVLAETQEILHLLRGPDDGRDDDGAGASHLRLGELVDAVRSSGAEVEAEVGVLDDALPPQTSAAAYRITQEALTNARRHGSGPVRLQVRQGDGVVTIEAANRRAAGPAAAGGGHGLVGMRERAVAAGGRLELDGDDDVFRLRAVLPATGSGAP